MEDGIRFQLRVHDPEAAAAFFRGAFGWTTVRVPGDGSWLVTTRPGDYAELQDDLARQWPELVDDCLGSETLTFRVSRDPAAMHHLHA